MIDSYQSESHKAQFQPLHWIAVLLLPAVLLLKIREYGSSLIRRRGTFCKAEDSTLPPPMSLLTNKINSSWLQI